MGESGTCVERLSSGVPYFSNRLSVYFVLLAQFRTLKKKNLDTRVPLDAF